MQDRVRRQERRRVVFVLVDLYPVMVVPAAVDRLTRPAGQDRFEAHALAARVHVRLEAHDPRRLREHHERLDPHVVVTRRYIEVVVRQAARRHQDVLRLVAFRVELEPEINPDLCLLAVGVRVHAPGESRIGR